MQRREQHAVETARLPIATATIPAIDLDVGDLGRLRLAAAERLEYRKRARERRLQQLIGGLAPSA